MHFSQTRHQVTASAVNHSRPLWNCQFSRRPDSNNAIALHQYPLIAQQLIGVHW